MTENLSAIFNFSKERFLGLGTTITNTLTERARTKRRPCLTVGDVYQNKTREDRARQLGGLSKIPTQRDKLTSNVPQTDPLAPLPFYYKRTAECRNEETGAWQLGLLAVWTLCRKSQLPALQRDDLCRQMPHAITFLRIGTGIPVSAQ